MNNHDILGTNESWSQKAIRRQFKLLSLKIHPDKSGTSELFKIVHIAYKNIISGKGNEHFVYLPSEVIVVDEDKLDAESLRIKVHQLLEDIKIKTDCLTEANAEIRKLTAYSDVAKVAKQLKFVLITLFVVMVCGSILLMSSLNEEEDSILPTPRFFISSMPETLPVKPKILLKAKTRSWKDVPGYSKSSDFGEFILITELGIPTLMFQIDKSLYNKEQKAMLRNEKHGSCEAALSVNNYQRVGLINPFARATVDENFIFSIWLFDSVDLAMFKDFEVLTLICDDIKYSAHLKPAK
jgi:hypothetical protein